MQKDSRCQRIRKGRVDHHSSTGPGVDCGVTDSNWQHSLQATEHKLNTCTSTVHHEVLKDAPVGKKIYPSVLLLLQSGTHSLFCLILLTVM